MKKSEIEKKIIVIIARKTGIPKEKIKLDHHLSQDLGLDSFSVLEVLLSLEKEFKIVVPEEKARFFVKIKNIANLVEDLLAK